ncbi:hypothetical protein [Sellimonas catena]|nr:hypothetical protein [Sellimonas catena]
MVYCCAVGIGGAMGWMKVHGSRIVPEWSIENRAVWKSGKEEKDI